MTLFWLLPVATTGAQTDVQRELEALLAALPHAETVAGVSVVDLATGASLFEQNAHEPMIPASNMKVFVMAAAPLVLGPECAFNTILATDGTNLVLVGDGDPGFGDERLYRARGEAITADFVRWAETLHRLGMTVVPGDIVIDESIFDDCRVNPTWEAEDLGKWYAAPVGGLNFNDNCVDITLTPAAQPGAPALVTVVPENSLVKIINQCRTGGERDPILHHPAGTFEYRISGGCRKRWPFGSVSFPDPGLLTADSLRSTLQRSGISILGQIRRRRLRRSDGSLPESLTLLDRRRTPLADVLQRVGKDSQNLFAECLLKRIGYEWAKAGTAEGAQGSWDRGSRALRASVEGMGIDPAGLVVADGSGLSRANRCTARQLTAVLAWMRRQAYDRLFRDSFSIAGVDGSLRKRLKDLPDTVRAKTGTMRGIRTLSGYVKAANGREYAFAVLFNGYKGPSTPYKRIQDRICRILAGPAGSPARTQ